jgi:hypothetical protein
MKYLRIAALFAAIAALPAVGFAQAAQSTTNPAKPKHAAKVLTASMTGVVKRIDESSLVIARSNAKGPEETFQLDPSHKGKLAVGDVVNVKYYLDNGKMIATAVTVKKPAKSTSGK